MRTAQLTRETAETKISLSLNLDGTGVREISTGCGFLNHMLELFAAHGRFDLTVSCQGDTDVDYHHTVEDVGIVLGKAFREALTDRAGIRRYGSLLLPMDETLVAAAVDLGRAGYFGDLPIPVQKVGDFDTELCDEFFAAFVREANCTLHLRLLAGRNAHHIIEAAFKGFARAMREACSMDPDLNGEIPSSKGTLS